jgi:hypothetical protein
VEIATAANGGCHENAVSTDKCNAMKTETRNKLLPRTSRASAAVKITTATVRSADSTTEITESTDQSEGDKAIARDGFIVAVTTKWAHAPIFTPGAAVLARQRNSGEE